MPEHVGVQPDLLIVGESCVRLARDGLQGRIDVLSGQSFTRSREKEWSWFPGAHLVDVIRQSRASRASAARNISRVTLRPFRFTLAKCLPRYWSKSSRRSSEILNPVRSNT